ncbi:CD048 protein, partial [Polyodon spathula]|nr:CD048 protein [Polyodon spathula]
MMRAACITQSMCIVMLMISVLGLICVRQVDANQETGTILPAESRPCVDCHAFEFMQRALQDLKKTAFNLDSRVNIILYFLSHVL